jgi:predicted permease
MVFPTILAEQAGQGEREMASALFLSTITSFVVITAFIAVRGLTL